jgi:CubicO group peptidase (beta-lactamase class C family)
VRRADIEDQLGRTLDLICDIEQKALETGFSGVISIFGRKSVIYNRAFGFRDVKNKVPNNTETLFGIASGTKLFTALGIGKLVELGMISLDTSVREIDAKFRTFIDGDATILNLLTHTSGMYDYYDEEIIDDFDNYFVEIPWFQLETPLDYFPLFENRPMKNRSNERYSYSNGGFVLLGMIVEKVSGTRYRDFIGTNVLDAAGMKRSGFYAFNDLPPNTAHGYKKDGRTTNVYNLPIRGGGDGGMYTTTEDLRAFWESLFSNRILSEDLTKQYLITNYEFNDASGYGCGIYKALDDTMFSIVGGDAGVGFHSAHFPSESLSVNILSNITDGEEEVGNATVAWAQDSIRRSGPTEGFQT